jgi:hypothetical protein
MDGSRFDTLARTLSGFSSRRGVLGLLIGSALSSLLPQRVLPGAAQTHTDKKTRRERERERARRERERERRKKCKESARRCRVRWFGYCNEFARPHERVACVNAYNRCCNHWAQCNLDAVVPCLKAVPEFGGCPNPTDTACPTGCCPADFPVCPSAGSAGQCCPGNAPFGCPNGSCTQSGFVCCPNNTGSCRQGSPCCGASCCGQGESCCPATQGCCPTGTFCCDNGLFCCPNGTFCAGGGFCVDETGLRVAARELRVATDPMVRAEGHPVPPAP